MNQLLKFNVAEDQRDLISWDPITAKVVSYTITSIAAVPNTFVMNTTDLRARYQFLGERTKHDTDA